MTFFRVQSPEITKVDMDTPYSQIPLHLKRSVRELYIIKQKGLCLHCHSPLDQPAPDFITEKPISKDLFPDKFFNSPVHLHHDHVTDKTLGVVHNYCNAVLWQYFGE